MFFPEFLENRTMNNTQSTVIAHGNTERIGRKDHQIPLFLFQTFKLKESEKKESREVRNFPAWEETPCG